MDWNVRRLLVAGWTNEVAILFALCAVALSRMAICEWKVELDQRSSDTLCLMRNGAF